MVKTTPEAVEVVRDQLVPMELGIKEEKVVTDVPPQSPEHESFMQVVVVVPATRDLVEPGAQE
ncbi:unannotated protein [freshwater metagenome]|uniref:Unannotated protein n=1 Tax=freshwater metagenome TaxID=449393 RepID=A0A6J6J2X5_9ZZZZ